MSDNNQIPPLKRWDLRLAIILSLFAIISYLIGGCEKVNTWWENWKNEKVELVNLNSIKKIEKDAIPIYKKEDNAKYSDIVEYYFESNKDFRNRLKNVVNNTKKDSTYRSASYIPAPAGFGKSWIGHQICKLEIPEDELTIISLKDSILKKEPEYVLNNFGIKKSLKSDLIITDKSSGESKILNELTYFDEPFSKVLGIEGTPKRYVLIDDLDEVHPDVSKKLLKQVEEYINNLSNSPINFIVLGRPEAFYPYINEGNRTRTNADIEMQHSMHSPDYKSYADMKMRFNNWINYVSKKRSIPQIVKDSTEIYNLLVKYMERYPYLKLSFLTAANSGNIIDYAIGEHMMASEYGLDNEKVLRELLVDGILKRNKDTHNRPAQGTLNFEEYNLMIAEIAKEYYTNGKMEGQWFAVTDGDELTIELNGKSYKFNVRSVLDRSGLVDIKPTPTNFLRYKFEPFWLHRYYLEYYNEELKKRKEEDKKNTTANKG